MVKPPRYCWSVGSEGQIILFILPDSISLCLPSPRDSVSRISIALLPKDALHLIIDQLHPVDRVCLALACKALCAAVLTSPALTQPKWTRFAEPNVTHPSISHIRFPRVYASMPDVRTLVLRLAHGWIDKSRYLYCWKCHRILSRDEKMWRERLPESVASPLLRRLNRNIHTEWSWFVDKSSIMTGSKKQAAAEPLPDVLRKPADEDDDQHHRPAPQWSLKTLTDKATWDSWTRTQRYDHLVKTWCYTHTDDSSALACEICAAKGSVGTAEWQGILDGANGSVLRETRSQVEMVHPVECPSCLQKELTWRPKRPGMYESWRMGRRYRRSVWANFTQAVKDFI
ncbi:hypothetical protein DV735_g907, partial [Chaetothyriales sp. CBS 134920]